MSPYRFAIATMMLGATLALRPATVSAQNAAKVDVSGKWQLSVTTSAGTGTPTLTLVQRGDSLAGHYSSQVLGESEVKGVLNGSAITFSLNVEMQGTPIAVKYSGTVESGDAMKGTVDLGGQATGTFTAKRQ